MEQLQQKNFAINKIQLRRAIITDNRKNSVTTKCNGFIFNTYALLSLCISITIEYKFFFCADTVAKKRNNKMCNANNCTTVKLIGELCVKEKQRRQQQKLWRSR